MAGNASDFIPGLASGTQGVTGELRIDTGLARVKDVVAMINESNISPDEESVVSWYQQDADAEPGLITLRVEKGGANHGTLGDTEVQVSWVATAAL